MIRRFRASGDDAERGQILPLFALVIVVVFGMAALAIDVSNAYSDLRYYRSVADTAALAAAQDLQGDSRVVDPTKRPGARQRALDVLARQLFATSAPTCSTASDVADCAVPGTDYLVSVTTPAPGSCMQCIDSFAVKVGIRHPNYRLTFANALGQGQWNLGIDSVAGLTFGGSYAIVTLRPIENSTSATAKNIRVEGGTVVNVTGGDVGSNANMEYNGSGSILTVEPGYKVDYYDPYRGPMWGSPASPPGTKITTMIPDPNYPIPSRGATPPAGGTEPPAVCDPIADALWADPGYRPFVPANGPGTAPDYADIDCYRPGVYGGTLSISNGDLGILTPGLYFLDRGADIQGGLIGGYTGGSTGVAIVVPQTQLFRLRTGGSEPRSVMLNGGSKIGNPATGLEATAARDFAGNPIHTGGSTPVPLTLIVPKDPNCNVVLPYPVSCDDNHNDTIDLAGGSALYLAGVQYAPSDNVTVAGGSSGVGYVGQIIAWTVKYTGGSAINQDFAGADDAGTLRIDAACSAPGTSC